MTLRALLLALTIAAVAVSGPTEAFAQKTKTKGGGAQTTTTQPAADALDPSDPDDLETILDQGDAAYFPASGQPDFKLAYEKYALAAEAGDAYAMNRVALMYDRGEYVRKDLETAFEWYLKAAEAGLPAAQGNVGSMYQAGDGVAQDYREAMRWYRTAAENGYGYAMYAIGDLYLSGLGVSKDSEEATAWYRNASDAGDANGHWSLALRYLYGDGIGKDSQEAAELAYLALTKGLQVALDEFKTIGTAETSPNFRRAVQELLKRDGYYDGAIDGSFGPATVRALEAAFNSAS